MTSATESEWLQAALGLPEGARAFPWQTRLLRELVAGRLPSSLDLPTGLGKTSVMAVWLVARALGAAVPRRLIYVVDRRAVVDQATRVANDLKRLVENMPALRQALGVHTSLPISTLRGQFADNRDWLADPSMPAIVVGTVDMVGSRLLFSGYGVSRKMRPYHAGMLGADAWLVLDEAHLVPAFERLVQTLTSGADAHGRSLRAKSDTTDTVVPPSRVLSLSATGRQHTATAPFTLDADDLGHPVVRQRLQAPKRIRLHEAVDAKSLPDALAAMAWDLCEQGRKPARMLVFVNSREHAQKTQQALRKLAGKPELATVELFVGGRRGHEREQAARRLAELGFLAGANPPPDRPTFVVATSAGEVGVDLDAEHAVCDLVAWERMVQRLGRVNRRGSGDATVIVVPAVAEQEAHQQRQAAVKALLELLPLTSDGARDGSPAALTALKTTTTAQALIESASTPAPLHPPLVRALVDAWAMTSLDQHTGRTEVAPWLRGWPDEPEPPQVSIVWRSHLPLDDQGRTFPAGQLELFLDAAGPHMTERLDADLPLALDWLVQRVKRLPEVQPGTADANDPPTLLAGMSVAWVLDEASGRDRVLTGTAIAAASRRDLEMLLRGTTLWVHRQLGGLRDGLLDDQSDAAADDVSVASWPDGKPVLPFRVRRVDTPDIGRPDPGWRHELSVPLCHNDVGVTAWLLVSSRLEEQAESEEGRSSAQRAQLLGEHQDWAAQAAHALAHRLRLPEPYAAMLTAAAAVHDEGKRAACWQRAFHAPKDSTAPYAKTVGRPNVALLDGYRHEFGSLPHAEADARVRALAPDLQELCLHLVAAHHGAARPLIRTHGADEPPSRAATRAQQVAQRFCTLSERWGPWGLAWWEALLRAADQQASRRNDEAGEHHG